MLSDAGLRDTSRVWSGWRGFLCLLGTLQRTQGWPRAQLHPAHQLACTCDTICRCSSGLWLDSSRCVTKSRSAFPEPELLRALPQSPGPRACPQGPMRGQLLQQHEPCCCSPCCMPSASNAHEPVQLSNVPPFAVGSFRCGAPSCPSTLTSPPLLPGKAESLTHLVFKATMAAACESLVGQAVGPSTEGIWTSLQLLDTILLL